MTQTQLVKSHTIIQISLGYIHNTVLSALQTAAKSKWMQTPKFGETPQNLINFSHNFTKLHPHLWYILFKERCMGRKSQMEVCYDLLVHTHTHCFNSHCRRAPWLAKFSKQNVSGKLAQVSTGTMPFLSDKQQCQNSVFHWGNTFLQYEESFCILTSSIN